MKKILFIALGCLSIGTVASAQTIAQKAADKEFSKYNQTGEFERCVHRNNVKKMVVIDDTKILLKLRGNKFLLNTLDSQCMGLAMFRQFTFATNTNRMCDTDIIQTRRDICSLSKFEVLEEKF